jgi:hypothetical protein
MTTSNNMNKVIALTIAATFALSAAAFIGAPEASAATYAYVDATGEVRSVVANDWMQAIATAPNIHIHSGVFTLKTAADYKVIGSDVQGAI